jgi:hypothetical protein
MANSNMKKDESWKQSKQQTISQTSGVLCDGSLPMGIAGQSWVPPTLRQAINCLSRRPIVQASRRLLSVRPSSLTSGFSQGWVGRSVMEGRKEVSRKKWKEMMKLVGRDMLKAEFPLGFLYNSATVKWIFIVLTPRFVMSKMGGVQVYKSRGSPFMRHIV